MKKTFLVLTLASTLALAVYQNSNATLVGKDKECWLTYYSDGSTSVSCSGKGSTCATLADCKGCW